MAFVDNKTSIQDGESPVSLRNHMCNINICKNYKTELNFSEGNGCNQRIQSGNSMGIIAFKTIPNNTCRDCRDRDVSQNIKSQSVCFYSKKSYNNFYRL